MGQHLNRSWTCYSTVQKRVWNQCYIPPRPCNETYDVTDWTFGPYYEVFVDFSNALNFTYHLYKRKDGLFAAIDKYGGKEKGMITNLMDGSAEIIASPLSVLKWRAEKISFLPKIGAISCFSIYPSTKQWRTTFIDPFATDLWLFLLAITFVTAVSFKIASKSTEEGQVPISEVMQTFIGFLWLTFSANFSGKQSKTIN